MGINALDWPHFVLVNQVHAGRVGGINQCRVCHRLCSTQPTMIGNSRHPRSMINGYNMIIDRNRFWLERGHFIDQTDNLNCGPIACLKLMELYWRIDVETANNIYWSTNIRNTVMNEWEHLLASCNSELMIHIHKKKEPHNNETNITNEDVTCGSWWQEWWTK